MLLKTKNLRFLGAAALSLLISLPNAALAAEQIVVPKQVKIEAVFVLDTTGSMSGLIQAAKDKIWAIANTLAQAKPTPEVKVGLVGYRDRGDEYVTKLIPHTTDLDATYRVLMDFKADGGGDSPESVNQALAEAVNKFEWNSSPDTYKVIFLVGDAPPHMDYQDDIKYQTVLETARKKGIIVNAVQCGSQGDTTPIWQEIARLGEGNFFQVAQGGDAFVKSTPYDAKLAELSAARDGTRLSWGSEKERRFQDDRKKVSDHIAAAAPASALASRAEYNASEAGAKNFGGEKELVADVTTGKVKLETLKAEELPEELKKLTPEQREKMVKEQAEKRKDLDDQIKTVSKQRQDFLAAEAKKSGKDKSSLDAKVFEAVKSQAAGKGIAYDGGPSY